MSFPYNIPPKDWDCFDLYEVGFAFPNLVKDGKVLTEREKLMERFFISFYQWTESLIREGIITKKSFDDLPFTDQCYFQAEFDKRQKELKHQIDIEIEKEIFSNMAYEIKKILREKNKPERLEHLYNRRRQRVIKKKVWDLI